MTEKNITARVKSKRDTSANWETRNPVLLNGEIIVVDTEAGFTRFKIGDGTSTYTQLPFTDNVATQSTDGLMSAVDKQKLDDISLTAIDDGNGNVTLLWCSTEVVTVISSDEEGTLSLS